MRFTEPLFLQYLLSVYQFQSPVLEIGSGWTPDYHLDPFRKHHYTDFLTQDIRAYEGSPPADLICDACSIPRHDASIGTILCFNVLEHHPAPWRVVQECRRLLVPGGYLIGAVPMRCEIHRHSRDYWRFCPDGIAELLRFSKLEQFAIEGNPANPANLLFAAVNAPTESDWLAHNEMITSRPLLITDTDYYTDSWWKRAVVRFVRRFEYDVGRWTNRENRERMRELGFESWTEVRKGIEWPRSKRGIQNGEYAARDAES